MRTPSNTKLTNHAVSSTAIMFHSGRDADVQRRRVSGVHALVRISAVLKQQINDVDSAQEDGGGKGGLAVVAGLVGVVDLEILPNQKLLDRSLVVLVDGLDQRNLSLPATRVVRIGAA